MLKDVVKEIDSGSYQKIEYSYMPEKILDIVNLYKSNLPLVDMKNELGKKGDEGHTMQAVQKSIFFYNKGYMTEDLFSSPVDFAFQPILINKLIYPRIIWFFWFEYIALHGCFILSENDHRKKIDDEIHGKGPYLKILIKKDVINIFKNFMKNILNIPVGKESQDVGQLNFKDFNNIARFLDPKDLPGSDKKIICGRFDANGDPKKEKSAFLYSKAEKVFDDLRDRSFGSISGIEEIKDHYKELGLNLIPINCLHDFDYKDIKETTNYKVIIKKFKSLGIHLTEERAKILKRLIKGFSVDKTFSSSSTLGCKKLSLGVEVIPELKYLNSSAISFQLYPRDASPRKIIDSVRKEVLIKYGCDSFNGKNSVFYNKEDIKYENNLKYADYLRYKTCLKLLTDDEQLLNRHNIFRDKDISYYKSLENNIDFNTILNKYKVDIRAGYHCHHNIFWHNLVAYCDDGFDMNSVFLLSPISEYEHRLIHNHCLSNGNNEFSATEYIVSQGWKTEEEMKDLWRSIVIGVKNEEKRIGKKTKIIKYLKSILGKYID